MNARWKEKGASLVQVIMATILVGGIMTVVMTRLQYKQWAEKMNRVVQARESVALRVGNYLANPLAIYNSARLSSLNPQLFQCTFGNGSCPASLAEIPFSLQEPSVFSGAKIVAGPGNEGRYDLFGMPCEGGEASQCFLVAQSTFVVSCPGGVPTCSHAERELSFGFEVRVRNDSNLSQLRNVAPVKKTARFRMTAADILKWNPSHRGHYECPPGEKEVGRDRLGNLVCHPFAGACDPAQGAHKTLSDRILKEIRPDGTLACEERGPNVRCAPNQWVVGIDRANHPICSPALRPPVLPDRCFWTNHARGGWGGEGIDCGVGAVWSGESRHTCNGSSCVTYRMQILCCRYQ